jgi:hypothetical protein
VVVGGGRLDWVTESGGRDRRRLDWATEVYGGREREGPIGEGGIMLG